MSNMANTRQIRLARRTSSYWRVTFDHPPLNIFGPETIPQLNEIVTALETEDDVKVVVFDSAVEGFFLTTMTFSQSRKTQLICLQARPACRSFLTCWYASAALQSCPSSQSAGARPASAASLRSQAICALRVAKRRFCRNLKLVPAWFQAARLRGAPGSCSKLLAEASGPGSRSDSVGSERALNLTVSTSETGRPGRPQTRRRIRCHFQLK
jgi:hypothetical protein